MGKPKQRDGFALARRVEVMTVARERGSGGSGGGSGG